MFKNLINFEVFLIFYYKYFLFHYIIKFMFSSGKSHAIKLKILLKKYTLHLLHLLKN